MAQLFFVRHQAAGILHEHPWTERPSNQELEDLVMSLRDTHGVTHPKTGETYWSKLVSIDTSKAKDDPTRVEIVGGIELVTNPELPPEHPDHVTARVVEADVVNERARGHCPIAAGEVEVIVCEHGYNDLAICQECGPYIREGYTRTDLTLARTASIPLAEARRQRIHAFAKAGLGEVKAGGVGHVENPPGAAPVNAEDIG